MIAHFTGQRARRALILSALGLALSASNAWARGITWWCYRGTCCEMEGQAVTSECIYNCKNPDGVNLAWGVLYGCYAS